MKKLSISALIGLAILSITTIGNFLMDSIYLKKKTDTYTACSHFHKS